MGDVDLASAANPLVKELRQLHRAVGRRRQGRFLVEGRRAIGAWLQAGWRPVMLFLADGLPQPADWPLARRMSQRVAEKLTQAKTASGYLAVFAIPPPPVLDAAAGGLVLQGIADPGNLGTLLRSAAAFGCRQVVLAGGADPWSAKVVQASAGALARLAIRCEGSPIELAAGAPLIALVVADGAPPSACAGLADSWLVVGSEADGIAVDWLEACRHRLTLPMPGGTESLNAAVAGALALFLVRGLHRSPG